MLVWACAALSAQPTVSALSRTYSLQSKHYTGTMFCIDVDGREYWITAVHILTGAKGKPYGRVTEKTTELHYLNPGGAGREWIPMKFSVLQPAEDVDVAVFVPERAILEKERLLSPPATSKVLCLADLASSWVMA